MTKGSMNVVEVHVEKALLALAVVFFVLMFWWYVVNSPHRVKIDSREVTPGALNDAVLESARELERTVASAKPPELEKLDYSTQLVRQHRGGLLESLPRGAPPLRLDLPRTAMFGRKADIPDMGDVEEASASIALVTPLPPTQPRLRTGRSLVKAPPRTLGPDARTEKPEDVDAMETPWVSVGVYFDTTQQREEMMKSQYAAFRARVYVVGMDVQRQERLSSGEYSEWQDVRIGKAMPSVALPEPEFDDKTGALVNKDEIDKAFTYVRDNQKAFMQPDFPLVAGGDYWELPPLEGLNEDDEEIEVASRDRTKPPPRAPAPTPPRQVSEPIIGGKGTRGDVIGPGTLEGAGRGPTGPSLAQQKTEAGKQARKDYSEARLAYRQRDYAAARSAAQRILAIELAPEATKKRADKLLALIERAEARQRSAAAAQTGVTPAPTRGLDETGAKGFRGGDDMGISVSEAGVRGPRSPEAFTPAQHAPTLPLVKHPDRDLPAVWFHDDTVEGGKTYRYRARVRLWNRYVGRTKALRDPAQARQTVIVGEWSLPSDEITVTPKTYFFVIGPGVEKNAANVEVWAWRESEWVKQSFQVQVGDEIGSLKSVRIEGVVDKDGRETPVPVDFGTGAIVLDIREAPVKVRAASRNNTYTYRDVPKALILTYVDPADGQAKERIAEYDRDDPVRKRLKEEYEL